MQTIDSCAVCEAKGVSVRGLNARCCCCIFTRYQSVTGRSRNSAFDGDRLRYSVADTFCRLRAGSGEYINHSQCVLLRPFFSISILHLATANSALCFHLSQTQNELRIEQKGAEIRFVSCCVRLSSVCRVTFFLHSIRFIPFNAHTHTKMGCIPKLNATILVLARCCRSIVFESFLIALLVATLDSRIH